MCTSIERSNAVQIHFCYEKQQLHTWAQPAYVSIICILWVRKLQRSSRSSWLRACCESRIASYMVETQCPLSSWNFGLVIRSKCWLSTFRTIERIICTATSGCREWLLLPFSFRSFLHHQEIPKSTRVCKSTHVCARISLQNQINSSRLLSRNFNLTFIGTFLK